VNSAIALAKYPISISVLFDSDDACFLSYIEQRPLCVMPSNYAKRHYYVALLNNGFADFKNDRVDVDLFVTCNNDMEFMVHGWDMIAKSALYDYFPDGMGVVEIGNHPDLSYNTFISRVSFWTKHYNGELFDPRYTQYYADADRLKSLEENGQFARIYPGLVNTHTMFDEVWHEGRQFMARDKEAFDAKHESR